MLDIDQYILLFLKEKKEEIEEFKDYIKTSKLPKKIVSHSEWEAAYLNWAIGRENSLEKASKMPKIYLNND